MLFFDCQPAPSPRRVRMFIAEKGVEIPVQMVDLGSGEHLGESFRALNPDCTVPVLQLDDGSTLTESLAICDYLETRFPEPPLMGTGPDERARVLEWNAKVEQQGLAATAEAFRNFSKGFKGRALTGAEAFEQIPELVARGRHRVELFMKRLDAHLAANTYLCGEQFTLPDITALVCIDMCAWIKMPVPDTHTHLKRWHDAVSARPSARV